MISVLSSVLEMPKAKRPRGEEPKRPEGDPIRIDDAWRTKVLARMKEREVTKADLARAAKVTPGAITQLLKKEAEGGPRTSRIVNDIEKELAMDKTEAIAVAVAKDELFLRLKRVWSELSPREREHLITTGELLRAKR